MTESNAQSPSRRTGTRTLLPPFLPARASSAPFVTALVLLLALVCSLLSVPSASADSRIGAGSGSAAGQLSFLFGGLAASDKEGGDIYTPDAFRNQRIDQYEPDGTFVRAFGWGVLNGAAELQTCTIATGCREGIEGSGPGQLDWSDEIAIDNDSSSPSYGDLYVVDQRNLRVEKFGPDGEFLLMFGGEVDKTTHADLCTSGDLIGGDTCGAGVPGTGAGHFYQSGAQSWAGAGNNSIAVGPDGTVYAGDFGRIQEFNPDGAFIGEFQLPDEGPVIGTGNLTKGSTSLTSVTTTSGVFHVGQPISAEGIPADTNITAISGGTLTLSKPATEDHLAVSLNVVPQFVSSLAIDSAGDIYERSATSEPSGTSVAGIREYGPGHTLLRTFDESGEPVHIALDSEGTLFAGDLNGGNFQFRAFKPTGALYAVFTSDQASGSTRGIAIGNASHRLYATAGAQEDPHIAVHALPEEGPPLISEESAGDIQTVTATLHAIVNPSGFETTYHFEYGTSPAYGQSTAPASLDEVIREVPVAAPISALAKGTIYHFRLVASNSTGVAHGPDQTFETLPPVTVANFTTQTVGPELVALKAELNPNGSATHTSYTIHYGTTTAYDGGSVHGELGPGSEPRPVTATFTGLEPNTTYHYQLTAENEFTSTGHPFETADQTFTTELSVAEEEAAEVLACPNVQLRHEDNSTALPDCRAYEQVSPPDKGGDPVVGENDFAPGGERDMYQSQGVFAGAESNVGTNPYLAQRTASGWVSRPMVNFPAGPDQQPQSISEADAELDRWIFQVSPAPSHGEEQSTSSAFYMGKADGSFVQATPVLNVLGGRPENVHFGVLGSSADLSDLYLLAHGRLLETDERPNAVGIGAKSDRLYKTSDDAGSTPTVGLAAEVPLGLPDQSECWIGGDATTDSQRTNGASVDGSTIVYEAPAEEVPGGPCDVVPGANAEMSPVVNPQAIYARIGQAAPIRIAPPPAPSPSQCHSPAPCFSAAPRPAHFYGASPDDSQVWFTTRQSLVDSDGDPATDKSEAANDLYLAKLSDGQVSEFVQVSHGDATDPVPGRDAGVKGVVRISSDGLRAYFVATGVLTANPNGLGESATQGADNLYAYDATGGDLKFVARLCSDAARSGSFADPACGPDLNGDENVGNGRNDSALWTIDFSSGLGPGQVQVTPDGRYLLFKSFARLTPDDTDNAADLYRYDFETGRLLRVSFGHRGNDANGNDAAYNAEIGINATESQRLEYAAGDNNRAISSDGSTIVFETAAPLVSRDTNTGADPGCSEGGVGRTGCDVYEWEEDGHGTCAEAGGCISLLSDGREPFGSQAPILSSSGRDVTFQTAASLLPADTDGIRDVYDARQGGGFPNPTPPIVCAGNETCHQAPGPEPAPPKITSESPGPGNGSQQLSCAKGKVRVKKHGQVRCVANHKKHRKTHKKAHKHHKHKGHQKRADGNRGGGK